MILKDIDELIQDKEDFCISDIEPKIFTQQELIPINEGINKFSNKNQIVELLNINDLASLVHDKDIINNTNSSLLSDFKVIVSRFIHNLGKIDSNKTILNSIIKESLTEINNHDNYLDLQALEHKRFNLLNNCTSSDNTVINLNKISVSYKYPNLLNLNVCINSELKPLEIDFAYDFTNVYDFHKLRFLSINSAPISIYNKMTYNKFETYNALLIREEDYEMFYQQSHYENVKLVICNSNFELFKTLNTGSYDIKIKASQAAFISLGKVHYNEILDLITTDDISNNELIKFALNDSKKINQSGNLIENITSYLTEYGFKNDDIIQAINKDYSLLYDMNKLILCLVENFTVDETETQNEEIENIENIESTIEDNINQNFSNNEPILETTKITSQVEEIAYKQEVDMNEENIDLTNPPYNFEIENERKNNCFECFESNKIENIIRFDYFSQTELNSLETYINFELTNKKLSILYNRRTFLNLIQFDKSLLFNEEINFDDFMKIIILIINEAVYSNIYLHGSDELIKIKEIFSEAYLNKSFSFLVVKYCIDKIKEFINSSYDKIIFFSYLQEKSIIPLFSCLWLLSIANDAYSLFNFDSSDQTYNIEILDNIFELVYLVQSNMYFKWFNLEVILKITHSIGNLLLSKENTKNVNTFIDNSKHIFAKLRQYLDDSIARESKSSLSKRSQMICEILIFYENIIRISHNAADPNDEFRRIFTSQNKADNFITELLNTYDFMKEFFEKEYFKYLGWVDLNPDLLSSTKIVIESEHLYPKAKHTFLIYEKNANALEINISKESFLDSGSCLIFSLDKDCKNPLECFTGKQFKESFIIQSSHVFVHCPADYITKAYCFGDNTSDKCGISSSSASIQTPKLIESIASQTVDEFYISCSYVLAKSKKDEIFSSGKGLGSGLKISNNTNISSFTKAVELTDEEITQTDKIKHIITNQGMNNCTVIVTKENNFYCIGDTYNIGLGTYNKITSLKFNAKVKKLAMSSTHLISLCENNIMYHLGSNSYYQNGSNTSSSTNTLFKEIIYNKEDQRIEDVSVGESFSIFIFTELTGSKKGFRHLYSAGDVSSGKTGTGKDESCHGFMLIQSMEEQSFSKIYSSEDFSCAINTEGKLYTWGSNKKGNLGLGHYNDMFDPVLNEKIDYEKLTIESIALGLNHLVILANEKDKNENLILACGDTSNGRLGENIHIKYDKSNTCPILTKVSFFEGKKPYKIFAGQKTTVVMCKTEDFCNQRDSFDKTITCKNCENKTIKNIAYLDFNNEYFLCNKCYKNETFLIAFTSRIKDDFNIKLLKQKLKITQQIDLKYDLQKQSTCKECKIIIENNSKQFSYIDNNSSDLSTICETCVLNYPFIIPSARPLLVTMNTVIFSNTINMLLNTSNYYQYLTSYGFKLTVNPFLNENGSKLIIEQNEKSFNTFTSSLEKMNNYESYEQFVGLLNSICTKQEKNALSLTAKDLQFKKEDLSIRERLNKVNSEVFKNMFTILKLFNIKISKLLSFIDLSSSFFSPLNTSLISKFKNNNTLLQGSRISYYFNKITSLTFFSLKYTLFKQILKQSEVNNDSGTPNIRVNRIKIRTFIDKGKVDFNGQYTMFGNIYQNLKNQPGTFFRCKIDKNTRLFSIDFIGEGSIDVGGPYREAWNSACVELQSANLPLFIPSPNQKNDSGKFREKWIVNPSANSLTQLSMFNFLGCLIGFAIRSGEFLNLDLPSIFWKQLLDLPLDRRDLENIDREKVISLENMASITNNKDITQDNFSDYFDQKFTTILSNGTEIELIPNGRNIELTFNNRIKYCELVEKIRLNESQLQMNAIKKGLETVIPPGALKLLSYNELETLVCGEPIIDVELLKENTQYKGCLESDLIIIWFWKLLEEFTPEERSMYLRFVWGRSRLPLSSKDFNSKHKIQMLNHAEPDSALPNSHTCFFTIDIPKYSSYDILKNKMLYAITNCQSIDTDFSPFENWDGDE